MNSEPIAEEVEGLLRNPDVEPLLSAVNLFEIYDHLMRIRSHHADDVTASIGLLLVAGLRIAQVDEEAARLAGSLRARHYDKRSCNVSLADCTVAASARLRDAALATCDPHLADLCRSVGVELIGLKDSSGKQP